MKRRRASIQKLYLLWNEWAMCTHIPNRGEQTVRYCCYYSNIARGKRKDAGKDAGKDDDIPCTFESQGDEKTFRRSCRQRLILWSARNVRETCGSSAASKTLTSSGLL